MLTSAPRVREGMVWFRSGHFYNFHYTKYANDPIPTVVMLNWVHGTHPNTGHKHNYVQCINLSYIPRNYRKKFVEMWLPTLKRNKGNVKLTWSMVISKWPFMRMSIRRYILKNNFIKYAREIPPENVIKEVVSTWTRDYSMMAMKQLAVLTDRMREKNPKSHKNLFAKSLSKYLYKYNTR
jgi:hypothetical protein